MSKQHVFYVDEVQISCNRIGSKGNGPIRSDGGPGSSRSWGCDCADNGGDRLGEVEKEDIGACRHNSPGAVRGNCNALGG